MTDHAEPDTTAPTLRRRPSARRQLLTGVVFGEFFSIRFIRRHAVWLVAFVVLVVVYVADKYRCQTRMETIGRLRTELNEARSVAIEQRSRYMGQIREADICRRADSMGLGLSLQDRPPYTLYYAPQ